MESASARAQQPVFRGFELFDAAERLERWVFHEFQHCVELSGSRALVPDLVIQGLSYLLLLRAHDGCGECALETEELHAHALEVDGSHALWQVFDNTAEHGEVEREIRHRERR